MLAREYCSGASPHFFRLYKKSTKKVRRGCAHPLDSRGRRKTPAPHVLRRYLNFHSMWKRKNAQFFFTSQRQRANTSVFFEICGFLLYWDLVLYLSFRAGIYGTKTGLFSRKIKFVIFACSFASIAAALRRLWGRAPFSLVNSVRFMRRRPINSRSGKLL